MPFSGPYGRAPRRVYSGHRLPGARAIGGHRSAVHWAALSEDADRPCLERPAPLSAAFTAASANLRTHTLCYYANLSSAKARIVMCDMVNYDLRIWMNELVRFTLTNQPPVVPPSPGTVFAVPLFSAVGRTFLVWVLMHISFDVRPGSFLVQRMLASVGMPRITDGADFAWRTANTGRPVILGPKFRGDLEVWRWFVAKRLDVRGGSSTASIYHLLERPSRRDLLSDASKTAIGGFCLDPGVVH